MAEIAVRFLEHTQLNSPIEMAAPLYESELNTLHEMIQQTVSCLLTDNQSIVKQTIIESGITKLCVFFGRQKGNIKWNKRNSPLNLEYLYLISVPAS